MVCCFHAAQAVAYTPAAAPMTLFSCRLLLGEFIWEIPHSFVPALAILEGLLVLYAAEAGARAIISRRASHACGPVEAGAHE